MTKKEKILSSFIVNIIEDEKPSSLHILSEKDLSQLLKRIEKTKIKSLNISPQRAKKSDENFDLYIILDDIKFSEADIGTVKNLLSQKVVVFTDLKNDKNTDEIMLKLGFNKELRDKTNKLKCFSYNLKTYNNKRTWNNPTGWANPENFDKFRW